MRIKTIAVTYGRKFNLGNYNSLNIEVTAWADLDVHQVLEANSVVREEGEDPGPVYTELFRQLRIQVKEYYLRATVAKAKPAAAKPAGTAFSQDSIAEWD